MSSCSLEDDQNLLKSSTYVSGHKCVYTHDEYSLILCPIYPWAMPTLNTLLETGMAPLFCCWCMLMCHIHLFVCLIWILLVSSHVHAPPTPLPLPLALIHTSCISCSSSSSYLLSISFPPLRHQGARLPGSQPALARSRRGGGGSAAPLPVRMQIGLVLIKRQLHISLKSPVEVGKEKAYLSREAEVV